MCKKKKKKINSEFKLELTTNYYLKLLEKYYENLKKKEIMQDSFLTQNASSY